MNEIFELQRKLNNRVCPFDGILSTEDDSWRAKWVEKYRLALFDEFNELFREIEKNGLDTQNGKVEMIDILHFLVSVSMIVDVTPCDAIYQSILVEHDYLHADDNVSNLITDVFHALADLQNSCRWKWWAVGKPPYVREQAIMSVISLWNLFWKLTYLFEDFCFVRIKDIYIQKNRINHERQDKGYNEMTKTEDDNKSIAV